VLWELVEGARQTAIVLVGRCLAYGGGITFWPLVEVLRQAADTSLINMLRRAIGLLEMDIPAMGGAGAVCPSCGAFGCLDTAPSCQTAHEHG
jgi:hypothetical protein